jgi:hypothetical protein
MNADLQFKATTGGDVAAIRRLLADCQLPSTSAELLTENSIVAMVGSRLVGTVALEPYDRLGFLRSLAVAPDYRRRSLRNYCPYESGAEATAVQTLPRWRAASEPRGALGLRRVHRRFGVLAGLASDRKTFDRTKAVLKQPQPKRQRGGERSANLAKSSELRQSSGTLSPARLVSTCVD